MLSGWVLWLGCNAVMAGAMADCWGYGSGGAVVTGVWGYGCAWLRAMTGAGFVVYIYS